MTPSKIVARGAMKPSSLSHTYEVRVEYTLSEAPKTFVEAPKLTRRAEAPDEEIPHTYDSQVIGKERPCTFFRPTDWNSALRLSQTVLPWLASWLVDYELWHATGKWSGGGVSHSRSINDSSLPLSREGDT
ncbi:MAG: hypothetical protein QM723_27475 [Myxococcaceae bacterium]